MQYILYFKSTALSIATPINISLFQHLALWQHLPAGGRQSAPLTYLSLMIHGSNQRLFVLFKGHVIDTTINWLPIAIYFMIKEQCRKYRYIAMGIMIEKFN